MRRDYHDLDFLVPAEDRNEYVSFREWMGWNCPAQPPFTMYGARFTAVAQVRGLNIYACDKEPRISGNFDACYIVISGPGKKMPLTVKPDFIRNKTFTIRGIEDVREFLSLIRFKTWEECPTNVCDLVDVLMRAISAFKGAKAIA